MKALRTFAKKLFSFRKIVWLFLCGMLIIAEEAGAQQGDQGNRQPTGGKGTTITEPVVKYGPPPSPPILIPPRMTMKYGPMTTKKYGPPSSFKPKPLDGEKPNQGLIEKTPKAN